MKMTHVLIPAALAVCFATALPTMAAEEQPADVKAEKAKAKKKKVRPHSHLEEKTGMPVKAMEETKPEDKGAEAKKNQHLHPRDGK